jgi:hypothetical protein
MSQKTIRLSVDVSPQFYKMLDKMAEESHSSKSDILKKSVVLMNVALDEGKKGHQVGIIDKDDKLITKIIGI